MYNGGQIVLLNEKYQLLKSCYFDYFDSKIYLYDAVLTVLLVEHSINLQNAITSEYAH